MSRRRFLFWRDLAPSIRHVSLMSSTTLRLREARFWIGYRRGSGSPFQVHPRLRRQNAVIPINGLATLNCARSAGSQPILVIAKGLIVRSFLPSKAANRPYRLFLSRIDLAFSRGRSAAPQTPVRLGPMPNERLLPLKIEQGTARSTLKQLLACLNNRHACC